MLCVRPRAFVALMARSSLAPVGTEKAIRVRLVAIIALVTRPVEMKRAHLIPLMMGHIGRPWFA